MRELVAALVVALGCARDSSAGPPAAVTDSDVAVADTPVASPSTVTFTDTGRDSELPPAARGCLIAEDLNGDGRTDLIMGTLDNAQRFAGIGIFENIGAGRFKRVALFDRALHARSCALARLDADDLPDLVLVGGSPPAAQVVVLRGSTTARGWFDSAAPFALPAPDGIPVRTVRAADLDNDGLTDLYLGLSPGADGPEPPIECRDESDDVHCYTKAPVQHQHAILHNEGEAFSLRATSPAHPGLIMETTLFDLDGDGYLDLLESVDFGSNRAFLSNAGASFMDATESLGFTRYNNGMGLAVHEAGGATLVHVAEIGPDQFWIRELGASKFRSAGQIDVARPSLSIHSAWGPILSDFNNDGELDLLEDESLNYATRDELRQWVKDFPAKQATMSLCVLVIDSVLAKDRRVVHRDACRELMPEWGDSAVAAADFDADGKLDAVVVGPQRVSVLMNTTRSTGHYLQLQLVPRAPRRSAVGAKIKVFDGDRIVCNTTVGAGGSRGSSWDTVHCGLGSVSPLVRIEVHWLGGGIQKLGGPLPLDRVVRIAQE